jgi:hypothetical protein
MSSWSVSDISLKIKGNENEENIKIRTCDGYSTKVTETERPDVISGYSTYILVVSSDGYVIKDGSKLYVTQMDSDGIGLNNLTVTHIIILPEDVNVSAEKSEEDPLIQQIEKEINDKGNTIIEKKTFKEDGTEYMVVFVEKDEIPDNILIYDLLLKKNVLDLKQSGEVVPYVDLKGKKTDCFEIADKNKDGIKELIFSGDPVASSPGELLIINKFKEGFGIMFCNEIYNYQFIDTNRDGILELYGTTRFGGQVSYDVGFSTVYELKNNKYISSYELTRNYESRNIKEYEQEFKRNPTIENLDKLIYLYAYLGEGYKCINLKESNKDLINDFNDPENDDYFKYYFGRSEVMAQHYNELWFYLRIQSKLKNLEAAYNLESSNLTDILYSDIDGDGKIEAVVSYGSNGYADYSYNFILKEIENEIREYELPEVAGYYIESIRIVKFDDWSNKYIYCQITNGVNPLGCAVYGLKDNELVCLFNQANATGAGAYYITDYDKDGIYDEIVSLISDYGVFYHSIETHYKLKDGKFEQSERVYYLDEYRDEPEELIFDYLDTLWLEKYYGPNEDTKKRIKEILVEEGLRQIDVSEYIDNLFDEESWDVEDNLEFDVLKDTEAYKEFVVGLKKDGAINRRMTFCLRFNAGKWQIEDIR